MNINIICNNQRRIISMIDHVIQLLNGAQNYFYFSYRTEDIFKSKVINWTTFCNTCQPPQNGYDIYITELPFEDNWFSHESYFFFCNFNL